MKKLCVLVALLLRQKTTQLRGQQTFMVTFISTWAPKRMFDFIVGFIIRKGLSRRLERVARKISLNQPPEKERLLIMNRLNAR